MPSGRAFFDGLVRAGAPLERLGVDDVKPHLHQGKLTVSEQRSRPLSVFVAVKPERAPATVRQHTHLLRGGDAVIGFAAG